MLDMGRKIVRYAEDQSPVFDGVSGAQLDEFVGGAGKRSKESKAVPNARFERAVEEVGKYMMSGVWDDARPLHFVALYARMHEGVYGVAASDLGPRERHLACLMAGNALKRDFAGSNRALAEFVRWTWQREQGREKWRRENGAPGRRIGWQLQFNGKLVPDYRLELERRRAKGAPR